MGNFDRAVDKVVTSLHKLELPYLARQFYELKGIEDLTVIDARLYTITKLLELRPIPTMTREVKRTITAFATEVKRVRYKGEKHVK